MTLFPLQAPKFLYIVPIYFHWTCCHSLCRVLPLLMLIPLLKSFSSQNFADWITKVWISTTRKIRARYKLTFIYTL